MKIIPMLMAFSLLCGIAAGQTTRVPPPKIDYAKYGSLHTQMVVYENVQRRIDALERERYRKFREEVRRQAALEPQRTVVVARNYTYGDALASWRARRDRPVVEVRSRVIVRGR